MGFGDELIAAGQAQRLFDADQRRVAIVDSDHKRRWHPIWDGNPIIVRPEEPDGDYHVLLSAPNARPYIIYPFTEQSGWTFNRQFRARDHIAKIYLTETEWQLGQQVVSQFGNFVLIEPWSKHINLRWPLHHWEELIKSRDDLTFVQHTHKDTKTLLVAGAVPIETHSFRDACGVLSAADCYIRGESGMLHAAAALGVPSVAIWGGCMDWDVLGGYPQEVGVGIRPPFCGKYTPCDHCAKTMDRIDPESVSVAIALATRWAGKVALQ